MKNAFCSRDISLNTKMRLLRCYVFSTLLYGMEAWTLKKKDMNRLEAFEMWAYRRILRISWVSRITNQEVLRRMGKEKELIKTIKRRKLQYLGHVIRGVNYNILQIILEGKICGKRMRGRRRTDILD